MQMLMLLLALVSCSTKINQKERMVYDERSIMRHGIIPLEPKDMNSKEVLQKFSQQSIQRGQAIYQKDCLKCHGPKGHGDGVEASLQKNPVANLARTVMEVPRFQFYLAVSQWQKEMPGWKTPYSAQDREDLAAYISTFKE